MLKYTYIHIYKCMYINKSVCIYVAHIANDNGMQCASQARIITINFSD